ncbi:MAG: PASTA domain-containing protein [Peptococcaceae bacterium]|nr:PASTA domain-containing protein [Peptococcaceae bacterium]
MSDIPDASPASDSDSRSTSARVSERSVGIIASEHETELDRGYNKRKLVRYGVIGGTVIMVAIFLYLIVSIFNQITVKNFIGTSINDAKTWGITNKVSIEIESVYNNGFDSNHIIAQSQDSGKKIRKGSVLAFQVSLGPDPEEIIKLPEFESMNTTQIYAWKDINKANNVNVMQENSDEVEINQFIRKDFSNPSITEDNYTRKDGLLIYMSKGQFEKNITVPDFRGKFKREVDTWARQNKIDVVYLENSSGNIPKDCIISQEIEVGVKIAQNTKISFVVSTGKAVIMPNFSKMTKEEATTQEDISVTVKTQYSATVTYGKMISQSVPVGRQFTDETVKVFVVYSEGRPFMDDLVGKSEKELPAYFYDFTSKGAAITYNITYVDSSESKGQVTWMSIYNQYVEMNTCVEIRVSRGNLSVNLITEGS